METKYRNMYEMLCSNNNAWQYFNALPESIRDEISARAGHVCTYSSLRNYADTLRHTNI